MRHPEKKAPPKEGRIREMERRTSSEKSDSEKEKGLDRAVLKREATSFKRRK